MSMRSLCQLGATQPHKVQTYVLKSPLPPLKKEDNAPAEELPPVPALLRAFGHAELLRGAGAYAVIQTEVAEPGIFLVLSLAEPRHFESFAAELSCKVEQRPGHPKVEWVRALTRRLQRPFGWGDVASTRDAVTRPRGLARRKTRRSSWKSSPMPPPSSIAAS